MAMFNPEEIKGETTKWDRRFLEVARLVATWSKDYKEKMANKIANDLNQYIGYATGEPRKDGMVDVHLGSGFFDMALTTEKANIAVSGLATAMQKIPQEPKHQRTVSYKCCGCSRFFSEKDWPRCPHCGAEATRL